MKTTLELPDELTRAIKLRAVQRNRKLKDEIADLLRLGIAREPAARGKRRKRVTLPLVRCAHRARPGEEISPQRAAEILLREEADAGRDPLR